MSALEPGFHYVSLFFYILIFDYRIMFSEAFHIVYSYAYIYSVFLVLSTHAGDPSVSVQQYQSWSVRSLEADYRKGITNRNTGAKT